jgi:Ca2+-binding RTX toxin-like protein
VHLRRSEGTNNHSGKELRIMKEEARVVTAAQHDRRVRGGLAQRQLTPRWRLGSAGIATLAVFAMGSTSNSAQAIGECSNNSPQNPPAGYVVVDLTNGGNPNGGGASEFIWGTTLRDVITGGGGDDIICGRGGNDEIHGDAGNDQIHGGGGPDEISEVWTSGFTRWPLNGAPRPGR